MSDLSTIRLNLLRAGYLLLVVGLGTEIWPLVIHPPPNLELMRGVVWSMLTALSVCAIRRGSATA